MAESERFPIDKLRNVSLTQIQDAIAKALQELAGEQEGFTARVHNMEFDHKPISWGRLRMELIVHCPDMIFSQIRGRTEERSSKTGTSD